MNALKRNKCKNCENDLFTIILMALPLFRCQVMRGLVNHFCFLILRRFPSVVIVSNVNENHPCVPVALDKGNISISTHGEFRNLLFVIATAVTNGLYLYFVFIINNRYDVFLKRRLLRSSNKCSFIFCAYVFIFNAVSGKNQF